jgi:hypothetical protein
MEALQTLKFMLKKKCLDFMDGWVTDLTEMQVEEETYQFALNDIMHSGDVNYDDILEKAGLFDD